MCWLRTYEQHLDQYDWFMKVRILLLLLLLLHRNENSTLFEKTVRDVLIETVAAVTAFVPLGKRCTWVTNSRRFKTKASFLCNPVTRPGSVWPSGLLTYSFPIQADDDSFVMVENLRLFLAKYDPEVPHFFGA